MAKKQASKKEEAKEAPLASRKVNKGKGVPIKENAVKKGGKKVM